MMPISSQGILWAQPELATIAGDKLQALMEGEIHDWLSALYWSEGIAARYALKMRSMASKKRKGTWERIYHDEVDHQLRVGRWLMDHAMPPLPPNKAVRFAEETVDAIDAALSDDARAEKIQASQLFFEEYTSRLLHWRLPHVVDRDLKACLLRISRDEAFHIAFGCAEVQTASGKKTNLDKLISSQPHLLFPVHLARGHLTAAQLKLAREKIPSVTARIFLGDEPGSIRIPEIIKRWESLPSYNCVACAPTHESGMHLEPSVEALGDVVDTIAFPRRMQGFNKILHGGFITMALDEMLGYAVILQKGLLPVTKALEVDFIGPVTVEHSYTVRSRVVGSDGQLFFVEGEIIDADNGRIKAKAKGDFYVPDVKLGRKLFSEIAEHDAVRSMLFGAVDASRPE